MKQHSDPHILYPNRISIWLGILVLSIGLVIANLLADGSAATIIQVVFAVFVLITSIFRPAVSLYLLVFVATAIEQRGEVEYAWTIDIHYLENLNTAYPGSIDIPISPLEIHLLFIIAGILVHRTVFSSAETVKSQILARVPLAAYAVSIVTFVLYGIMLRGGDFLPALWEVRGISYLFLLMIIIPQVIHTSAQARYLAWALVLGIAFRAIETSTHFIDANFYILYDGWSSHEDAGFHATMLVFAVAVFVYQVQGKGMKFFLALLSIACIIAMIASDRRTAYPILVGGLLILPLMMPSDIQRRIFRVAWKVGIVGAIYFVIGWNSQSTTLFLRPVHAIRAGIAGADQDVAQESYGSNLYREAENFNLYRMIANNPLLGTGYGVPIDYHLPIPVGWELGFYIPHNQMVAVIAKTGLIGFVIFMTFYFSVFAEIAHGLGNVAKDPFFRAILVLAGAAVINHIVFSFFDIMLTYYRNNTYLGTLLGLAAAILTIERNKTTNESEEKQKTPEQPAYENRLHRLLKGPEVRVSSFTR